MLWDMEKEGVEYVAKLAAVAARTAPKSRGVDHFVIALASGEERMLLAERMRAIGDQKELKHRERKPEKAAALKDDWYTDACCIEQSDALLLIGVNGRKVSGHNCGLCGYATCAEFLKAPQLQDDNWRGPYCANLMVDLGIAISSAASVAVRHHVDSRIFFKVGLACRDLDLMPGCSCIIGLPMSASGKNIYFDRPDKVNAVTVLKRLGID